LRKYDKRTNDSKKLSAPVLKASPLTSKDDFEAFAAIGRRYWVDGNDIKPREGIVQKVFDEGFRD
jgi:hypothetical protein